MSAITSIGSSFGYEFLAPEASRAVATLACLDMNGCEVYEFMRFHGSEMGSRCIQCGNLDGEGSDVCSGCCWFEDVHTSAVFVELHDAALKGEQSIVATPLDINAWMEFCSTLSDEY